MTRLTRILGQLVVGLTLVGVSGTAAWAAFEGSPGSSPASQGVLSGTIASVDPQHNLLKVKMGLFAQADIIVKESTKISDGAKEMTLQDLRPGDEVTVVYRDDVNGKRVAQSLTVNNGAQPERPIP